MQMVLQQLALWFLSVLTALSSLSLPAKPAQTDYPKAAVTAKTLLLTNAPADGSALTLASMQGLLANVSEKNLLFRAGNYRNWLPEVSVEVLETQENGKAWDLPALLKEFAPFFDGYILCDEESAAIALSIAKQKNSIVALPAFEEILREAGLSMTKDVRGMTDLTFRLTPEFRNLRRDVAFEQPAAFAPRLVDYAVMCGAYVWYDENVLLKAQHSNVFGFLNDGALVFGYNHNLGEYRTVSSLSNRNACLIPADHAYNLSVLSGFPSVSVKQKTAAPQTTGGRTVCLLMSDGDNLQWFMNNYEDKSHYGSPVRGTFPFAWGVPASAADLASPYLARYYRDMTENDEFVLSLSGLGYTFPSKWTNPLARNRMIGTLAGKMEALDTHALLVLDDDGFSSPAMNALAKNTPAEGIFYIDFHDYAGLHGKTRFVDGKPIVGARYKLWNGNPGCSPEEIAAAVNALPADPGNPDSYAFIIVHAWSGLDESGAFVESGNTMAAVEKLVGLLDENTAVVTPGVFLERLGQTQGK